VINNPALARLETNGTVKTILSRNVPPITINQASNLKVKDLWHENGMRRIDEIIDVTGLPMNLVTYMRLNTILSKACTRLVHDSKSQSIENFFNSFKKGSKSIRNVLYNNRRKKGIEDSRPVKSFFRIVACDCNNVALFKNIFGVWNWSFLTNRTRDFAFKFYNNILGTNDRVVHFNVDRNPGCTFCTLEKKAIIPAEKFVHVFYDCPTVRAIKNRLAPSLLARVDLNDVENRLFWLCGITKDGEANQQKVHLDVQLAVLFVNQYIWECKLRHSRIAVGSAMIDLRFSMDKCAKKSQMVKDCLLNSDVPCFRDWYGGGQEPNREVE
jgi:hypothetical protein